MDEFIKSLTRLLAPGVIGSYRSFEVTEIFFPVADHKTLNVFSLLVAESSDAPPGEPSKPKFLNGLHQSKIPNTKQTYGIARYRISLERLLAALHQYGTTGEWRPGSETLNVGKLIPLQPQFIPADAYVTHPWNGVLKNNFWMGSHVFELFDTEKADLGFLFDRPEVQTDLVNMIKEAVPIGLDALSDRIGNVVIQLPVTVAVEWLGRDDEGQFPMGSIWRDEAGARNLRISWETYNDGAMEGFTSTSLDGEPARFPESTLRSGARFVIWDDKNQVVLGASGPTSYIRFGSAITSSTTVISTPATRNFMARNSDGVTVSESIIVRDRAATDFGRPRHTNTRESWRYKRLLRASLILMDSSKEFKQYGMGPKGPGRKEAINDIRWLIEKHGRHGAWLWDPYLSADDVLTTLFFCSHRNADLRALTWGREPPKPKGPCSCTQAIPSSASARPQAAPPSWVEQQENILETAKGNCEGLQLEFRVRKGDAGWGFHDRFLIFPKTDEGAMAWSLGTSINHIGSEHHIMLKVPDGELIRQSFLALWNKLTLPEHLVWKAS